MSRITARPLHGWAPLRSQQAWSIGRLAPAVLVAWLFLDIALRFAPPDWLALRPILVAVRFPKPHAPFEPNHRLYTARFVGEAALQANLPTRERRQPIRFSTDHLGFRLNPYIESNDPPQVIVWRGGSFAYGASLSDEETFAAQFTLASGLTVYNAGRFHLDRDWLPELDWLLARLPRKGIYGRVSPR